MYDQSDDPSNEPAEDKMSVWREAIETEFLLDFPSDEGGEEFLSKLITDYANSHDDLTNATRSYLRSFVEALQPDGVAEWSALASPLQNNLADGLARYMTIGLLNSQNDLSAITRRDGNPIIHMPASSLVAWMRSCVAIAYAAWNSLYPVGGPSEENIPAITATMYSAAVELLRTPDGEFADLNKLISAVELFERVWKEEHAPKDEADDGLPF